LVEGFEELFTEKLKLYSIFIQNIEIKRKFLLLGSSRLVCSYVGAAA